jgi:hypothetical protein
MVRPTYLSFGFLFLAAIASAACDLANLVETGQKYEDLMETGDHGWFDNLSYDLAYLENDKNASFLMSLAAYGLWVSANRTFYDTTECKIFSEQVVDDAAHPRILNTQLYVKNGVVETIDIVATEAGDYNFDAVSYQKWAYQEKWDPIPADKRDTRGVLKAAADAYLDHLADRTVKVPAGTPCSRLEGGLYSGSTNATADTCSAAPQQPKQSVTNRRYIIDEASGVVNVFGRYGGLDRSRLNETAPASQTFRIEGGNIKYVHAVNVCVTRGCGLNATAHP